MRILKLLGTDIATTAIGFGCAGLYRLGKNADRRGILEAAYEAGIRHFDVAPMYGLGSAEAELAAVLKGRREDITVTTKFGIDVTVAGRCAARIQTPLRTALANLPRLENDLKAAGQGPRSGWVGRLLYASPGYDVPSAESSLTRSLKALGTDYVDVFVLHDPEGNLMFDAPELIDYLNRQCDLGRIRCWGLSGELSDVHGVLASLWHEAPLLQVRSDVFEFHPFMENNGTKARITYGVMERSLRTLRRYFSDFPEERVAWSERLGLDLGNEISLPTVLLREALRSNTAGPVLFSSTRVDRVHAASILADESRWASNADDLLVRELANVVIRAYPDVFHSYD